MVRVEVQLGEQEIGEKEAVVPEGRPEAEKDTPWVAPEVRAKVIVLVTA